MCCIEPAEPLQFAIEDHPYESNIVLLLQLGLNVSPNVTHAAFEDNIIFYTELIRRNLIQSSIYTSLGLMS